MNKKILTFICMVILVVIVILILSVNKNKCVNNGGKVITDGFGIYEKCIYGE